MTRRGWFLTFAVLGTTLAILILSRNILMPFLAGLILAYLISPLVGWLNHKGLPRSIASALPVAVALIGLGVGIALALPLLADQLASFLQQLPEYINRLQSSVVPPRLARILHLRTINTDAILAFLAAMGPQGATLVTENAQKIFSGMTAFFNVLMLVVMTPLVAFYLVYDWPQLEQRVANVLPQKWRKTAVNIVDSIDERLAAYLRGQLAVCFILAVFYGVALQSIGLQLGWILGILAGLLAFIPVVGALLGMIGILGMALLQYQLSAWEPYALVFAIYIVGQILEGSILTPLLIGRKVGLHPVWVIFALLVGGEVAGLLGMLLAIPAAVVVSVVMPYVLKAWHKMAA